MTNYTLEDYIKMNYSLVVKPDETSENETCYLACHPELDGCMAHGETSEEAKENLNEAKYLYIKTLLERNIAVPLPMAMTTSIWTIEQNDVFEEAIVRPEFSPISDPSYTHP